MTTTITIAIIIPVEIPLLFLFDIILSSNSIAVFELLLNINNKNILS